MKYCSNNVTSSPAPLSDLKSLFINSTYDNKYINYENCLLRMKYIALHIGLVKSNMYHCQQSKSRLKCSRVNYSQGHDSKWTRFRGNEMPVILEPSECS